MTEVVTRRWLARMVGLAFLWRFAISALTPIPSEDGVNYLWMAERFAAFEPALALDEVFPPLWPLAISPFVALGLDPFRAGQLAAAIVGALTVVPIVRITERVAPDAARAAAWFVVFAPLPTRFGGEVYSEPLFVLLGALAVRSAVRGRDFECGAYSGLAAWCRPEGILIALAYAIVRPKTASWRVVPAASAVFLALPFWRQHVTGETFTLVAKAGFNVRRLFDESTGVLEFAGHWFGNLVAIPWLFCEAFAVVGVLAVIGIARARQRDSVVFVVMLALGIALICAFLPRRRFLVSWFFAVVPLAAVGLRSLSKARDVAFILAILGGVLLSFRIQDADRIAERQVGEYLAEKMGPDDAITGDMTRVLYFAGRRPLPPRHFTADELVQHAVRSRAKFVVLGSKRDTAPVVLRELRERGYRDYDLTEKLWHEANRRGIVVLVRT